MEDGQEPRSQLRYYFYLAAFYDLFQLSSRLESRFQVLRDRERERKRESRQELEVTPRAIN